MNGYTKGARNEIFALRPCPIQVWPRGVLCCVGIAVKYWPVKWVLRMHCLYHCIQQVIPFRLQYSTIVEKISCISSQSAPSPKFNGGLVTMEIKMEKSNKSLITFSTDTTLLREGWSFEQVCLCSNNFVNDCMYTWYSLYQQLLYENTVLV